MPVDRKRLHLAAAIIVCRKCELLTDKSSIIAHKGLVENGGRGPSQNGRGIDATGLNEPVSNHLPAIRDHRKPLCEIEYPGNNVKGSQILIIFTLLRASCVISIHVCSDFSAKSQEPAVTIDDFFAGAWDRPL